MAKQHFHLHLFKSTVCHHFQLINNKKKDYSSKEENKNDINQLPAWSFAGSHTCNVSCQRNTGSLAALPREADGVARARREESWSEVWWGWAEHLAGDEKGFHTSCGRLFTAILKWILELTSHHWQERKEQEPHVIYCFPSLQLLHQTLNGVLCCH